MKKMTKANARRISDTLSFGHIHLTGQLHLGIALRVPEALGLTQEEWLIQMTAPIDRKIAELMEAAE